MTRYTVLLVPATETDQWSERIWQQPGILGIQELPADGAAIFRPDVAHHFVRFDQQRAFDHWLRGERWRRGDRVRLKIWHTGPLALPAEVPVVESGAEHARDYTATARRKHRGRCIGPFWVGPPWGVPVPGKIPVVIEPGTAFGVGDHPTTQMCLRMLAAHKRARDVLDFGAGTGVLAIAARRWFGRCRVHLVEPDRRCWPEIRHNFQRNRLVAPRSLHARLPAGVFDLVLANVYLDALRGLVDDLTRATRTRLRPGGRLIVSGLLGSEQREDFRAHAARNGWYVTRQLNRQDWYALELAQVIASRAIHARSRTTARRPRSRRCFTGTV